MRGHRPSTIPPPRIGHRALYVSLDHSLEVEAVKLANPFYLSYESAFKLAGLKRADTRFT